jgi:hypothetical protein
MELDKQEVFNKLNSRTHPYLEEFKETSCWLYTGHLNKDGYGTQKVKNKSYLVHKLSAWIFLEYDLESKLLVLHQIWCMNRNCWNPSHLYIGSQKQNVHDAQLLGNHVSIRGKEKTHCPADHEYEENTYIDKQGRRQCKVCAMLRMRKRRAVLKNNPPPTTPFTQTK